MPLTLPQVNPQSYTVNVPAMPSPLDQMAKMAQLKMMLGQSQLIPLQVQQQQQENQMRQIQLNDATGLKQALIDANGDWSQYQKNASDPKYGISVQGQLDISNKIMAHQKASYELDDTALANTQKKSTALAGHLEPLTELPDWQTVQVTMPLVMKAAQADGTLTQQEAQALSKIQNMDDLKLHVSGLQSIGDQIKQVQDARQKGIESWKPDGNGNMVNVDKTDPKFGTVLPISNPIPIPADLARNLGVTEMAGKPATAKQIKDMKDALDAGNHFENYGGNLHLVDSQGKELKTMGTSPTMALFGAQQGALTDAALDQSAQRYLETGQLPAGMRSPGMSSAIINRAGQLGGGQNIAANTAAFEANKASYENVTKTLDTLSAFEQTGIKNLKQFTDLASKIPDTGVPWVNTPVRSLDVNVVGSANMAAVTAARAVALREIARVTNDPKLSGQLSDHAREEVENLVPANATFNQIKAVANVLQTDMANVHTSLAAQKDDIGRRLGMQTHQAPQPNANQPPAAGKFSVTDPNGKTHNFPDQASADAFKKDAGIK